MLAILLVIQVLHKITPQAKPNTKIYCDNEHAVIIVNQIRNQQYPFFIKAANESEQGLLNEIKEVMKGLPSSLKVEWVNGHGSNPTRLQEYLNSRSGILATEH